jgi:malate dehydrogenase (oxaloacetate-decarboxylating)(NADP+)
MTVERGGLRGQGSGFDPLANKGTAYTLAERRALGLDGRLPPRVESLAEQAARVVANVRARSTALERYLCLCAVRDENETLFYRVVVDHLEELLPIVYTPTVGEACTQWSGIYERPRGIYLSAWQHRGRIAQVLGRWLRTRVAIIVVTDGGRILGLGDLGVNGMGIPIGKLALYTACAGVPPESGLPIALDVGTDNVSLREDPLYLGERRPRLTGAAYDELLDEFVDATQQVFPGVVVQFEDFNNASAFRLLGRHRDRLCCFNDDVQGTGAMGLAGICAAGRVTGKGLVEQRILFVGAGEACLGIGGLVVSAMQREGLSEAEALARCLFMDSRGLVIASRDDLPEHKRPFAQDRTPVPDLASAVDVFAPSIIVGACGQGGRFTADVLKAMARLNEHPVVFALSNPTSKAECTAAQAYAWSDDRAIFASGSPFPSVTHDGHVHVSGQGNNAFVFPGVGLGLLLSGARRVTDEMFFAAAHALAGCVTDGDLAEGRVFPAAARLREVARAVAVSVADVAYVQGHATHPRPPDLAGAIAQMMWVPEYR